MPVRLTKRLKPVAIVGPTATGKTAAAVGLAVKLGAEIISADSMAVYKGMDIGTAKPTAEEQKKARFYMIDVVEPDEPFTVWDFQEQASKLVDDMLARGALPIIVGGTGLYIKSLIDGLNIPGPGPNPELRERLEKLANEKGRESLYSELARVDPVTAERLHPNDLKRVIRALEVYELSGMPMSIIIERTKPKGPRYPDTLQIGLAMDRQRLYRRIEERVDQQIRDGLIDEVRSLLNKGYDVDLPSMQGLGYKEIAGYLKGEYDLETAVMMLKRDTRRFAKRQFTWFRADHRIKWIDVNDISADQVVEESMSVIRQAGIIDK